MRRVVHRQHDAGDDLRAEHEGENAAERPPVVQIARRRIGDEGRIDEARDRQPPLHPLHEGALRLVDRMCAHDRTLCVSGLAAAPTGRRQRRNGGEITPRRLRCGDCGHPSHPLPSCRLTPSALRTATPSLPSAAGGQEGRRRKARSHPTWGRSEATQSGGVLLAPLPRECKCAIAGTPSGARRLGARPALHAGPI